MSKTLSEKRLAAAEHDAAVVKYLESHPGERFTTRQLAERFSRTMEQMHWTLKKLSSHGRINVEGEFGHSYLYWIDGQLQTTVAGPQYIAKFRPLQGYDMAINRRRAMCEASR